MTDVHASQRNSQAGFSLIEMIVTVGIIGVLAAISSGVISAFVRDSRADSALASVMNTFRVARDRAIGERRNFEVVFTAPNRIQIQRVEIPGPAKTVVIDTYLEGNLEFLKVDDTGDTPDTFGDAAAIAFGASPTRMFTSEGTFVDNVGDPLNGTVFIAAKGNPTSARAITILGATALLHGWRWNGRQWAE